MKKTIIIFIAVCLLIPVIGMFMMMQFKNKPTKNEADYMIIKAEKMNYGEVNYESDYWSSTTYELNTNGMLTRTESYNLSEDKKTSCYVQEPMLSEIIDLINKTNKIKEGTDACDGEAWDIQYFDDKGSEINHFNGYVYGMDDLEKLTSLLHEAFEVAKPIGTCLYANSVFAGTNISTGKETWVNIEYTINYDGNVTMRTISGDMDKEVVKNIRISSDKVDQICKLMDQQKDTKSKNDVLDGKSWKFEYFDKNGKPKQTFHGYTEDYSNLKEIENILSNIFQ